MTLTDPRLDRALTVLRRQPEAGAERVEVRALVEELDRMASPAEIAREWLEKSTTESNGLSIQLRMR